MGAAGTNNLFITRPWLRKDGIFNPHSANILPMPKCMMEWGGSVCRNRYIGPYGASDANRAWVGTYYEILALNCDVADAYVTQIQGYLAHANGISAYLPPGHPYALLPPRIS